MKVETEPPTDTDQKLFYHLRVNQGVSQSWANSLIRRKNKFLEWLKENDFPTEPTEIPKIAIREYFDYIMDQYRPSTCRKRICAVRRWFEIQNIDTMNDMKFRIPEAGHTERPYYSRDEMFRLWRSAEEMGDKYHTLIGFNLGAGLRRIGCYRLNWDRVDLSNPNGRVEVIGKNKKRRTIVLFKKVTRIVQKWKQTQRKQFEEHDAGTPKHVFTIQPGKLNGLQRPNRTNTLGDWLERIGEHADVEIRDGFRQGRRSFAMQLYQLSKKEILVSQYLGHKNQLTKTTNTYLNFSGFKMEKEIKKIEENIPGRELEVAP